MGNLLKLILIVAFVIFCLIIGPWCMIWGINTLIADAMVGAAVGTFIPQITFGFWTWLAAVVVGGLSIIPRIRRS